MKCLVVDDDPLTCDTVESFLQRIGGVDYCLKVNDGATALHLLAAETFDAVFLDLHLPGMDGISLLKAFPGKTPVVVISASSEFGAESYGFDVVDYLVKPLEFGRFAKAVVKLKDRNAPKEKGVGNESNESLFLRDGNSIQRIDLGELLYIEAQSNYASFVFENEKPVMSLVSLRKLEDLLPSQFVRVHRSYIANERRIRKIEGNQLQLSSAKVPIGQSYRESLYQRLNVAN
ncbi:MAG: LytTR family DNA-binding domain-containing protein [Verrucomicrobiales bacterium]|nr:LytTR family DNA-binding domain-containing protein [Verrucomicrobiales bacterium]